jgi:YVTN family beta-propeller protein
MNRYLSGFVYLWVVLAMPLAASTARIYVSNQNGASVDVIDPVTNKVVQTIKGVAVPDGIVFSPDGSRAYICDDGEHVLDVVDTKTGQSIKKVRLSGHPNFPAITKDGKRVLVAINNENSPLARRHNDDPHVGAVDVVDTASLERVKTLPMKGGIHDIYTTADGKYAVAGSDTENFLTVIDLETEQIAWDLNFDVGVLTFAFENGPDGSTRRIFVELKRLNGFAVVDFAKHKEVARINLPDVGKLYFEDPTHGTGITPDGKTLWIISRGANNVYVFSLPQLKLLDRIPMPAPKVKRQPDLGGDPQWLAFTPDSKRVYVTMAALKSVSAIDVKTRKEVASIPVGENARHIATLVLP